MWRHFSLVLCNVQLFLCFFYKNWKFKLLLGVLRKYTPGLPVSARSPAEPEQQARRSQGLPCLGAGERRVFQGTPQHAPRAPAVTTRNGPVFTLPSTGVIPSACSPLTFHITTALS